MKVRKVKKSESRKGRARQAARQDAKIADLKIQLDKALALVINAQIEQIKTLTERKRRQAHFLSQLEGAGQGCIGFDGDAYMALLTRERCLIQSVQSPGGSVPVPVRPIQAPGPFSCSFAVARAPGLPGWLAKRNGADVR